MLRRFTVVLGLLSGGATRTLLYGASGESVQAEAETMPQAGLAALDWIIILLYASATIGLGYYYSRRQKNIKEYFVGSGSMNPLLVGVSLFATLLSTISYLAYPGEMIAKGPATLMTNLLSLPVIYFLVARLLLGVYMRQNVTSAYELLEERLGLGIRLLGAAMFLVLRLVWMSLLVYIAASAMTVMMGVGEEWIPYIVLATGFVSVIYTSLGGLGAVVVTDFLQTVLLLGGALLVVVLISISMDGFGWFPTSWQPSWDIQPFFSPDPQVRVTIVGGILTAIIWNICTAGGDQVSVQRFMATEDVRAARKVYLTKTCVSGCVSVALLLVGFSLLGYFTQNPAALPTGWSLTTHGDKLFPFFVAYHLPTGISGLVVAAMFAAAMSSVDSGVNSITAVIMTDFLDRFGRKPKTDAGHVRFARLLAFGVGAVVVVGSSFMGHVPGNFIGVTQRTTNLLVTPLFALFCFALFIPFSRTLGVVVGAMYGVSTALLVAFSGSLYETLQGATYFGISTPIDVTPISFQWIAPLALAVNLGAGSVASLVLRNEDSSLSLTWKFVLSLIPLLGWAAIIVLWPWIDAAFIGF